jgi:hypothetical protein
LALVRGQLGVGVRLQIRVGRHDVEKLHGERGEVPKFAGERAAGPTHHGCEALRDVRQSLADPEKTV